MKQTFIISLVTGLLIGNQCLLYVFPQAGIVSNAVLLVLFLLLAIYDIANFYVADILLIASVFPLINFCMFLIPFSLPVLIQQIVITSILLFLSLYYLHMLPLPHHYFTSKHIKYFDIVLLGIISIVSAIDIPVVYHFHFLTQQMPFYASLIFVLFSSIVEVVFFQGLLQTAIQLKSRKIYAVLITTILFTLFHLSGNFSSIPIAIFIGFLVAFIFSLSDNLPVAIGLNLMINIIFLFLVHLPLWVAVA